jgi:hypothetical protein
MNSCVASAWMNCFKAKILSSCLLISMLTISLKNCLSTATPNRDSAFWQRSLHSNLSELAKTQEALTPSRSSSNLRPPSKKKTFYWQMSKATWCRFLWTAMAHMWCRPWSRFSERNESLASWERSLLTARYFCKLPATAMEYVSSRP